MLMRICNPRTSSAAIKLIKQNRLRKFARRAAVYRGFLIYFIFDLRNMEKKFVDIEKILKEKANRLYRWLPGFAIGWLKHKLHEAEINDAMHRLRNDYGLDFNKKALDILGAKVESLNTENVPKTGNVTVASNHPLGGLDGMALIKAVGELRPDVHFFVNDILKNVTNYGDVFVAVNKLGAASTKSLRTMEDIFRQGGAVLIF